MTTTKTWGQRAFKRLNRVMLLLWRLGLGPLLNSWPSVGGRMMVLSHRGRVSGLQRRTPLNYAIVDGGVACVAGYGRRSDWYRNVLASPDVEVWLPHDRWTGVAHDVGEDPGRVALMRQVLLASGFAAVVAGVDPRRLDDTALAHATRDYRLVRIERTGVSTGPAPDDLAWVTRGVTAVAALLAAWAVSTRARRGRCCRSVRPAPLGRARAARRQAVPPPAVGPSRRSIRGA